MRKNKKTRDYIGYILPILIIILISIYFYSIYKPKYLEGVIIDSKQNYFEIITNNDSIYEFNKTINFSIGDTIKIKYNKMINTKKSVQNINIIQIDKISQKEYYSNKLYDILNKMTIDDKIGQLLMVRIPDNNKIEALKNYKFGGYILFQRDIANKTKEELKDYIQLFQNASTLPLFIAIDEEGGTVSRLSSNNLIVEQPFLSPQTLYKSGGLDAIKEDAIKKSNLLNELGINVNFAPVADVSTNANSYIYNRSFGKNAKDTAKYIETIMKTQNDKVTYVLKHFPGYGDNLDTHNGISIDNKSYNKLKNNDFLPFISGIENNAQIIMISHNIMTSIDTTPSTLSKNIHNILRNELNFNGIIITDDLSMNALNNIENPYKNAIKAGNNLLIVTNYELAFNEIKNAINNDEISEELINRLVLKNLQLKVDKELIN